MKTKKYNARFWTPNCNCDTREDSYKACMVHSCPCGCDMSIADFYTNTTIQICRIGIRLKNI